MVASSVVCMTPQDFPSAPEPGAGFAASSLPATLDRIGVDLSAVACAPTLTLSDGELRQALARAAGLLAQTQAAYLHLVAALDTRPDAVPGAATGKTAATFLIHATHRDPGAAARDVAAARHLDPTGAGVGVPDARDTPMHKNALPELGAALRRAEISREHVEVILAALPGLPTTVLDHVDEDGIRGLDRIDAFLTDHATRHPPAALRRITRHLQAVLNPDGRDPGTHERRALNMSTDTHGMLIGRFALDPAAGTLLRNVIHALAAPRPTTPAGTDPDGQPTLPLRDERTPEQRRADALTHLARLALGHRPTPQQHPDPDETQAEPQAEPQDKTQDAAEDAADRGQAGGAAFYRTPPARTGIHISLIATLDQAAAALTEHPHAGAGLATDLGPGGGPLHPTTLTHLLCQALIHPTLLDGHGAVLAHGRGVRLATPAQRRAVFARDRGCVIPGCTAPPQWCDIHHLTPWAVGGLTDVNAMIAACDPHHDALHAGTWTITMINDVPYVVAPS